MREPSYLSFVEASVILRKICKFFPEEMEPHPPSGTACEQLESVDVLLWELSHEGTVCDFLPFIPWIVAQEKRLLCQANTQAALWRGLAGGGSGTEASCRLPG